MSEITITKIENIVEAKVNELFEPNVKYCLAGDNKHCVISRTNEGEVILHKNNGIALNCNEEEVLLLLEIPTLFGMCDKYYPCLNVKHALEKVVQGEKLAYATSNCLKFFEMADEGLLYSDTQNRMENMEMYFDSWYITESDGKAIQ